MCTSSHGARSAVINQSSQSVLQAFHSRGGAGAAGETRRRLGTRQGVGIRHAVGFLSLCFANYRWMTPYLTSSI